MMDTLILVLVASGLGLAIAGHPFIGGAALCLGLCLGVIYHPTPPTPKDRP